VIERHGHRPAADMDGTEHGLRHHDSREDAERGNGDHHCRGLERLQGGDDRHHADLVGKQTWKEEASAS
jgi:hypothetical protein